jgi:hypothetical protein
MILVWRISLLLMQFERWWIFTWSVPDLESAALLHLSDWIYLNCVGLWLNGRCAGQIRAAFGWVSLL